MILKIMFYKIASHFAGTAAVRSLYDGTVQYSSVLPLVGRVSHKPEKLFFEDLDNKYLRSARKERKYLRMTIDRTPCTYPR